MITRGLPTKPSLERIHDWCEQSIDALRAKKDAAWNQAQREHKALPLLKRMWESPVHKELNWTLEISLDRETRPYYNLQELCNNLKDFPNRYTASPSITIPLSLSAWLDKALRENPGV